MSLRDIFSTTPHQDSELGELKRSRGFWRGSLSLASHGLVDLLVHGSRSGPDVEGLGLARDLPGRYAALMPEIQTELFAHYEPSRAVDKSDGPDIAAPEEVWPFVLAIQVRIEPLRTGTTLIETIEIAYRTQWDEEHIVGARIQDWHLIELCGSVLTQ